MTNFLSHAQVSGFMTGAAILIALSQVGRCWVGGRGDGWLGGQSDGCAGPTNQQQQQPCSASIRQPDCGLGFTAWSWQSWYGLPVLPAYTACPLPCVALPAQVKYILGLKIERADRIQDYLKLIFDNLYQFK